MSKLRDVKVRDVMTAEPIVLPAPTPLSEAAQRMRDLGVGDVLVAEHGSIAGILTDRDIVIRALADGRDLRTVPVGEVCTRGALAHVDAGDDTGHAVDIMRTRGVRRLPVTEDGLLVGVVSIGDLAIARDAHSALASISAAPPND